MKTQKSFGLLIAALCLLLCGCGADGGQENVETSEDAAQEGYYRISETVLPDPDLALAGELAQDGWIRELDQDFIEGKVYRIAQIWGTLNGIEQTTGYYLQILDSPYQEWKTFLVPSVTWDETLEYEGFQYQPWEIVAAVGNEVYCIVRKMDDNGNPILCLGEILLSEAEEAAEDMGQQTAEDASGDNGKEAQKVPDGMLLGEVPEELKDGKLFRTKAGVWYGYPASGTKIWTLDEALQIQDTKLTDGRIFGLLEDAAGSVFLYGESENGFCIRRADSGEAVVNVGAAVSADAWTQGADGSLYFADTRGIGKVTADGGIVQLPDFFEHAYLPEEILGIRAAGEEEVDVLCLLDGEKCLLICVKCEGVPAQKETVVLAMGEEIPALMDFVTRFNRQNEQYRIAVRLRESNETGPEFMDKLQMEITAGKGPDLLMNGQIDAADMAGNGYLLAVDDIFADGGELWTAAVESGKIDGIQYGVPYAAQLYFPTFSGTLTDGRSSWTLEEFMQTVRKSDAEILQYGFGGTEIVINYGLYDNANTELIDWERGESHLTEPLFLSLLEFAADYADTGKIPKEEVGEALASGRIAAEGSVLLELSGLNYREACFAGNPANIGFPRSSGNGVYLTPNMLYVNANSAVPEGAKAFLRFLISEESQLRYVGRSASGAGASLLPVRKDALEKLLAGKGMERMEETVARSDTGVSYSMTGLSELQQERFWELVEKAEPGNWYAAEISDLIYEELEPYFAGQRSAEEAAKNLDNRVQLYLDERK